jgi:hypothetical protein
MDQVSKNDAILLNNWAIVGGENGTYCKVEEEELLSIHLRGVVEIEAKPNACDFCPYKRGGKKEIETTSLLDVGEDGTFITRNHRYRLGNPHTTYKRLFGFGIDDMAGRLAEIIRKKKCL